MWLARLCPSSEEWFDAPSFAASDAECVACENGGYGARTSMRGSPHHSGGRLIVAILVAAIAAAPATAAASTVRIYSVAGAGFVLRPMISIPPPTGDGGPAGLARLTFPTAVAATPDGGFLVAETERQRIRRVSPRGIITTVAGTGRGGFSGDGGPATQARLDFPTGVAQLPDGAVAIADQRNNRVRLVDAAGVITTLAAVAFPDGLSAAADGGVLVVQSAANRVLHVDRAGGVTAVAGSGVRGFAGDGGPAVDARLSRPRDVAPTSDGGFLIADGNRVRRVAPDGTITTIAGNGATVASGDGGPATAAGVPRPAAVAQEADGAVLIASVNQVRRVRPDGVIELVAGTGRGNFSGDAGPAKDATLWLPQGLAAAAGGGILVADPHPWRIRFIDTPGGVAPGVPRLMAASFVRGIQRGEVNGMTRIRVACPPRGVAVRFALSRAATVSLVVTRAGRTVARPRARLGAGRHVLRFRVTRTGEHLVRLTAAGRDGSAHDQAQLSVNGCEG